MVKLVSKSDMVPSVFPTNASHPFDTPQKDVIVFYKRERGKRSCEASIFDTV